MNTILAIFVFVFGAIIGSFLNVVILRLGTGRSLGGRSMCSVTGKPLRWFELIPIVSFIIQGGRSRYSKTKISWQYPLVEFFTGLLFLFIVIKFLPLIYIRPELVLINLLFYFIVVSYLIMIFVYDMRHRIIPDTFLYPLAGLIFIGVFCLPLFLGADINSSIIWPLLAGPVVALPLLALWVITRGKGMGLGDVKLVVPLGWLLGLSSGFAMLLLSFWIGAVVAIFLIFFANKKMKSEIPFGPFIIISFILTFLYNIDMNSISAFFGGLI